MATALTPESVGDQIQVCLQPLWKKLSSLGTRLDAITGGVDTDVARNDAMAKKVAELFHHCSTLESRLDAIPLKTESQIMGYLGKTIREMDRLKLRFEPSSGDDPSKSLSLAGGCLVCIGNVSLKVFSHS